MEEKNRESAGQEFVRWLRPGGCILFLLVGVLMLVVCFGSGKAPIPGYTPPQTSAYYAAHLDELRTELETNVFPIIGGVEESRVDGDKLAVTLNSASSVATRAAILRYYDESLFEFAETENK